MTLEQLKSYRHEIAEIRELTERLDRPLGSEEFFGSSVIKDYKTGYPRAQTVSGYDLTAETEARMRWRKKLAILKKRTADVEVYIDSIRDSRTRRVFRLYFEDGKTENQVGRIMHIDRSLVSRIIKWKLEENGKIQELSGPEKTGSGADAEGRGSDAEHLPPG